MWQPTAGPGDTYAAANNLNQYVSWSPSGGAQQPFSYDGNGNMTSGTIAATAWTLGYDPKNRMVSASGGSVAAAYAYDPLGRRTHKSGTGTTETYYLNSGADQIAEYNSAGALQRRFVPGPAVDEYLAMVDAAGNRSYYHTDAHGSVIAITGANAALEQGPFAYDPTGNCAQNGASCTGTNPYRFAGMHFDPETRLYYDRASDYSPLLNRFLQTDAVGYTADMNLYAFAGNDPLNKTDATGNACDVLTVGSNYCARTSTYWGTNFNFIPKLAFLEQHRSSHNFWPIPIFPSQNPKEA